METFFKTIEYRGNFLEVEYETDNHFLEETLDNPAEYPQIEIIRIFYNETEVMELLEHDIEYIHELLINKLF